MTAVRRSARTRRPAQTVYDEAKKLLEEDSPAKSRDSDEEDSDDEASKGAGEQNDTEPESVNEEENEPSSDENSSGDEEEFESKRSTPRRSTKKFKGPAAKKIGAKAGAPTKKGARTRAPKGSVPPKALQTALASLAKKALEKEENPENSLAAALLQAHKFDRSTSKETQRPVREENRTVYTTGLENVARRVVEQNKDDPNKAQTAILNLIFRSVGGSTETSINPEEETLEDMDNKQWESVVTDLVDEMRHKPVEHILFSADPDGAAHAAAMESRRDPSKLTVAASALGVREYRKIFEEFFYVFGMVALSESVSSTNNTAQISEDEDEDSTDSDLREPTTFTSTSRFHTEIIRDVILRILELTSVGQPDIRAAATTAALCMARALLDQTVVLTSKIDVASRQFTAAAGGKKQRSKLSLKAESLKHQIDSLKRTRADLEEVVMSSVIQGVFMHRYRDSSMHIRRACVEALSMMTLQRPDLFLKDKYLKYFGWMMHDKTAAVRIASVNGLLVPFQVTQQKDGSKGRSGRFKIDIESMRNVVSKFLNRMVECVNDVSIAVQEKAMALLLALLQNGFLDDLEEDKEEDFWTRINTRAIARDASPLVRRDALYFIIDQLEPFDEEADSDPHGVSNVSSDKSASLARSSNHVASRRLAELVNWIAHTLHYNTDPNDDLDFQLADFIIYSLRDMPKYRSLATNWPTMLKSISEDSGASSTEDGDNVDDVHVRQRILVQMLACAAEAEVAEVADPDFLLGDVDTDAVGATSNSGLLVEASKPPSKRSKTSTGEGNAHETLSVALLKSLPELITKFKGDSAVLGSLTKLPRYLLPSVVSLPQRKKDFVALIKSLSGIFLESADDSVLQNTALSLMFLSRGDHSRARDGRLQLKQMVSTLGDRLVELLKKDNDATGENKKSPAKRRRSKASSPSSQCSAETSVTNDAHGTHDKKDVEHAIYLCLKRLRVLSKRCDLANLLESSTQSPSNGIEAICGSVVEGIARRLEERKLEFMEGENDDEETQVVIPDVWKNCDADVHGAVAKSTNEAMSFLLATTAWKLREAQEEENLLVPNGTNDMDIDESDEDMTDHIVVRLRDQLVSIAELCFEQYLPDQETEEEQEGSPYSTEHREFAEAVQIHAGVVASDLRMLFPREWADAVSPLLRACALTQDGRLIGGFIRFFRSKEEHLRESEREDKEDMDLVQPLLLTMGRGLGTNWRQGNRREAGVALAHVTGSGTAASDLIGALSRLMKKVEPVRLLEAHMACLRQSYEDWSEMRPDELENDCPTDEEMAAFEEEERKHEKLFHTLEQQGARLSMSLGVGKLRDEKLSPALLGFVKEGIRFAFSTTKTGGVADEDDDELMLGVRLTFLNILSRYVNWIKKNEDQLTVVRNTVIDYETELRAHEDFPEVHEDDLAALTAFRASVGLKETRKRGSSPRSVSSAEDSDESHRSVSMTPGSADRSSRLRGRLSRGSSISSIRSKMSAHRSLSPLYEEGANESDDDNFSPSAKKRRTSSGRHRSTSLGSALSHSTFEGKTQSTIEEVSGESSEEEGSRE